jgi:hypothetical protein
MNLSVKHLLLVISAALNSLLKAQSPAQAYKVNGVYGGGKVIVVKDGIIQFVGKKLPADRFPDAEVTRLKSWVYPGFIDAHCHFYYYGLGKAECNLVGCNSEAEMLERVKVWAAANPEGWILGRGWDQNRWPGKTFPDRRVYDSLFPNRPMLLKRVDGHAVLINDAARRSARFNTDTTIDGGEIIRRDGRYTGVLVDNASEPLRAAVPPPPRSIQEKALLTAAQDCLEAGLTGICDAGLPHTVIRLMDSLQRAGFLPLRISAMIEPTPASKAAYMFSNNDPVLSPWLRTGAVKYYLDGALGSRGACLKEDYCDRIGHRGMLLIRPEQFDSACQEAARFGFQVCVHAIGDSANRFALDIMKKRMPAEGRWRIEHAQVVDTADFFRFAAPQRIIPSVQPTHFTSDIPWAEERLCSHRMEGAYAYKTLLNQAGILPLGTDFPVEGISPLATYRAAVFRSLDGKAPAQRYMKDALTPDEAIRGMTEWAAYASRMDGTGVIKPGAAADLVFLSADLRRTKQTEIPAIRIRTMTDGQWRTP